MNRRIVTALISTAVFFSACSSETKKEIAAEDVYGIPTQPLPPSQTELIARGKYLVTVAGCNDCHTPKVMTEHGPEPDPTRTLSGHNRNEALPPIEKNASKNWMLFNMNLTAFVGPWGLSYAANLTPDDTGIGAWTFENFLTAIRKGKYKGLEGSRDLLPPMPWQMYRNMTDEDLKAVFTYLKSLPPINNIVPAPKSLTEI
jgi:hypothetical protein